MKRIIGIGQKNIDKKQPFPFCVIKHFLIVIFTIAVTFASNAQNKDSWTLYKDFNGIKVYTLTDELHDISNGLHYEYVLLKIVNDSEKDKYLSISRTLYYDGKKYSEDDNPINVLILPSGNTLSGNCYDRSPEYLKIFSRFLNYTDKPVLTGFDIIINSEDL